ncbi:medium-chain acyl-CoA ligase ACSF2, mitochondrial-like [Cryptotermes secundus]|uniref:medium-chain acyl-CoA ligase ACSF2, mitochondrial-like n=1 Tax=Cryptotermes secundus TaxID=105785 RepID=UPI001454D165|nr:medium-chain acyl-CoA ligase ACSF2, mitochondrial-like [Cryptotermes secundus]
MELSDQVISFTAPAALFPEKDAQVVDSGAIRVTVRQGVMRGKTMTSAKGRTFYSFQGIPYAKPPTGLLSVKAKVVDNDGRMVPMGTPEELWIRGYSVMLGYWDDAKETRQFIGPDGWVRTGDQFVLLEDGYGKIVGRIKEMIFRAGDKIFPKDIEDFFTEHPDVLEAQAFGVPDTKIGEEICVFLKLRDGATLTEGDVSNY